MARGGTVQLGGSRAARGEGVAFMGKDFRFEVQPSSGVARVGDSVRDPLMVAPSALRPLEVDVAIIGGGPAGAAAALTLLRYTKRRVAVVERSAFEAPRVGESTTSAIVSLLRFCDAEAVLAAPISQPACAAAAAWGGPEPMVRHGLFTAQGDGVLLDRRAFDEALRQQVAARGGHLLLRHELQQAERDGGHWSLTLAGPDGAPVALRARYVIDASGHRTSLLRQLGVASRRDDALVGVSLRFAAPEVAKAPEVARAPEVAEARVAAEGGDGGEGAPLPAEPAVTLVEAIPDGWWYTAPLPDGQLVAVLMTDAPSVRTLRLTEREGLRRALLQAPLTRARVIGRAAPAAPQVSSACSRRLLELSGPGWAATGDAAASFDPLSSMGIGHALSSGTHVARLADEALAGSSKLERSYGEALTQQYQQYLQLRQRYYRLEQRWADRTFWRARHSVEPRRVRVTPAGLGAGHG